MGVARKAGQDQVLARERLQSIKEVLNGLARWAGELPSDEMAGVVCQSVSKIVIIPRVDERGRRRPHAVDAPFNQSTCS